MKLREVRAAVESVEAILAFLNPSEAFLVTFRERSRAIGRAVIREHGWTPEQAMAIITKPPSDDMVLGDDATARFEEFRDWLAQHGLYSSAPTERMCP